MHVTRGDGTSLAWDFPSYHDVLPHDLVHFVVEKGLGLTDGFWGLVDHGADVAIVGDQAVLTRGGMPLTNLPGADFAGLVQAEETVALLGPQPRLEQAGKITIARLDPESFTNVGIPDTADRLGFQLPPTATPDNIEAIRRSLRQLAQQWRDLDDEPITLTWFR